MRINASTEPSSKSRQSLSFRPFYLTALLIVSVVMVVRHLTQAAALLPDLWQFVEDHQTYTNSVSIARFAFTDARAWLIFLFAAAPSIAAILVMFKRRGGAGVRSLLSRLKPWCHSADRRQAVSVYLVIALVYLVGVLFYFVYAAHFGDEGAVQERLWEVLVAPGLR